MASFLPSITLAPPCSSPAKAWGSTRARTRGFPRCSSAKKDSWVSPDWLTSLASKIWKDDSGIPVAQAKLEDVQDLIGGALFLPLFKWMTECGPVYRLAAGPRNFVIVSDPTMAKHVLRNYGKYAKGLVSEVAEFLFGSGFATAEGELWMIRRRAVLPSLHKKFLSTMVDRVFCKCSTRLLEKLEEAAAGNEAVDMEAKFSQLTLDIIGLSVFNYDFDSLETNSPVIQAVYTALKETELRSTDILPYWKIPLLCNLVPRQREAAEAVALIRRTVEDLVAQCKKIVEEEGECLESEEYINESDPSVLRFLLASRQENPSALSKVQKELEDVLGGRLPTFADVKELKYLTRCINESMRLFPHPPVLIRRALEPDVLPGGYKLQPGQDIMISVYNIHHSPSVWDKAEEFIPERFDLNGPVPNESNTDFRYIPFSGGPRKCVGDQFAMLEAVVALAVLLQKFELELIPNQEIGMTTGATIHTTKGLYMTAKPRLYQSQSERREGARA